MTVHSDARVIGIDAGGTKTLGLLVDERCELIRRELAGGGNIRTVGQAAAAQNLGAVLAPLLSEGGVSAVCVGAAGVGREADLREFEAMLRALLPAGVGLRVCSDAQIVLRAATASRPALALIAGTGSLVYGERGHRSFRAGGYGAVVGDPGSGYAIGLAAIQATAKAIDLEQAATTPLANAVMSALQVRSGDELVAAVHAWPPPVARIAALCTVVAQLCEHDDTTRAIVEQAGDALGLLAYAVAARVRSEDALPVVLSGGAFETLPLLAAHVAARVARSGRCDFIRLEREPAWGAVQIALELLQTGR